MDEETKKWYGFLLDMKPRLYTYLDSFPLPYVLFNPVSANPEYLKRNKGLVKSVILDAGVEIFRDENVTDYPSGHIYRIVSTYRRICKYVNDVYAVAPDYPDDICPMRFYVGDKTNIERTVENAVRVFDEFPNIRWILSIQANYRRPNTLLKCIELYEEVGLLDKTDFVAIANVCVEKDVDLTIKSVKIVANRLSNKRIHVFGPRIDAIYKVKDLVFSFDTFSWTYYSSKSGLYRCSGPIQRKKFFLNFLRHIAPRFSRYSGPTLNEYI